MNLNTVILRQKKVIKEIEARTGHKSDEWWVYENLKFAFHVELMELANEVGHFKHWKQSHTVDNEKAVEELADCIAFLTHVAIVKGCEKHVEAVDVDAIPYDEVSFHDLFAELKGNDLATSIRIRAAYMYLFAIGHKLGFNNDYILTAFNGKCDKNIQRQKEGY